MVGWLDGSIVGWFDFKRESKVCLQILETADRNRTGGGGARRVQGPRMGGPQGQTAWCRGTTAGPLIVIKIGNGKWEVGSILIYSDWMIAETRRALRAGKTEASAPIVPTVSATNGKSNHRKLTG